MRVRRKTRNARKTRNRKTYRTRKRGGTKDAETKSATTLQSLHRKKTATIKTQKLREEAESCPICLERIYDNSERIQLQCKHSLHADCMESLKSASINKCPQCRATVPELNNDTKIREYIEKLLENNGYLNGIYSVPNFIIPNETQFIEIIFNKYISINNQYDEIQIQRYIDMALLNIRSSMNLINERLLTIKRTLYTQKGELKKRAPGEATLQGLLPAYNVVKNLLGNLLNIQIVLTPSPEQILANATTIFIDKGYIDTPE